MPIQEVQIDAAATMTNGSTAVAFSRSVTQILGVEAGARIVFPSDPPNVYSIVTVADDGLSCVLSTTFAGPSGKTPCWFSNVSIPGMVLLGSAPLTTGATSIELAATVTVTTDGPTEICFASQPYAMSLVFGTTYRTRGPLRITEGSTSTVEFSPPYSGPTTSGPVHVGDVGINT